MTVSSKTDSIDLETVLYNFDTNYIEFKSLEDQSEFNHLYKKMNLPYSPFEMEPSDLCVIWSRSLDDVRMNLEVLKHCATVLLLVWKCNLWPHILLSMYEKKDWNLSIYIYIMGFGVMTGIKPPYSIEQ